MAEVASAFVAIVPSYRGGTAGISKQLAPAAERAGGEAGKKLGGAMLGSLAKLGIGGAVASIFTSAVSQSANKSKLTAMLGLTPGEAKTAASVAGKLYAGSFAGNLDEANEAIKSVASSLTGVGNGKELERLTGKALSLSKAFGTDVNGNVNAAANLMRNHLAKNADEAFDIIATGSQNGADKAGDLLDTFNEYAPQFRKLGLDGKTALGLISQGLQGGARDSDFVADALKEFSIRAIDGSKATASGFAAIGLSASDMAAKVAGGGPSAANALGSVLTGLRGIRDPVEQAQAAVALFGPKAEDLGASLFALNPATVGAAKGMSNLDGASKRVTDSMGKTTSPLETLKRSAEGVIGQVASKLVPAFEAAAPAITKVGPPLAIAALGILALYGAVKAGQAIYGATSAVITFTRVLFGNTVATEGNSAAQLAARIRLIATRGAILLVSAATRAWTIATAALTIVMNANPFVLIATLIVALVAVIVVAYKNSETFRNIVQAAFRGVMAAGRVMWSVLKAVFAAIGVAVKIVWTVIRTYLTLVLTFWRTVFYALRAVAVAVWSGIRSVVTGAIGAVLSTIRTVGSTISRVWSGIWGGLSSTVERVVGGIKAIVGGIWDGVTNGIKGGLNGAIRLLNGAIGFINSKLIDRANKVPFVDIPHIPNIPELAKGGIVPATPGGRIVKVAEAGQAEAVIPLDRLAEFAGGGGRNAPVVAGDLVLNVVDDPVANARAVERRLARLAAA